MRWIQLVSAGEVPWTALENLGAELARTFQVRCSIRPERIDTTFAFHPERGQHHATEILARLRESIAPDEWRLLGITGADLYIPILTFVFGEAQMEGPCAVVSTHRLRQEFYGLPPDSGLLGQRLLKESVHELGHTLGLTHCSDYTCAMTSSHSIEQIDLKQASFCTACREVEKILVT
jgi:archaemetzincin